MNKELQEYYEVRIALFCEKGWKDLMEDLEGMIEARDRLAGIKTEQELHFAKGELSIMQWLKNLERVSRECYEELQMENTDVSNL